jgi:hypothetical protein
VRVERKTATQGGEENCQKEYVALGDLPGSVAGTQLNRCFVNLCTLLIPDTNKISRPCEYRLLSANAMSDEFRVFLCFPAGRALMSHSVTSRESAGEIKVKLLHKVKRGVLPRVPTASFYADGGAAHPLFRR